MATLAASAYDEDAAGQQGKSGAGGRRIDLGCRPGPSLIAAAAGGRWLAFVPPVIVTPCFSVADGGHPKNKRRREENVSKYESALPHATSVDPNTRAMIWPLFGGGMHFAEESKILGNPGLSACATPTILSSERWKTASALTCVAQLKTLLTSGLQKAPNDASSHRCTIPHAGSVSTPRALRARRHTPAATASDRACSFRAWRS